MKIKSKLPSNSTQIPTGPFLLITPASNRTIRTCLYFLFNILFTIFYIYTYMKGCTLVLSNAQRGQKKVFVDFLKLELQTVVIHHTGAGNRT